MAIDLRLNGGGYEQLGEHVWHNIECVAYGDPNDPTNVAIECIDCGCVLVDFSKPDVPVGDLPQLSDDDMVHIKEIALEAMKGFEFPISLRTDYILDRLDMSAEEGLKLMKKLEAHMNPVES